MSTSSVVLRGAIFDALCANSALTAALGGMRIYDAPPHDAAFPYVTLAHAIRAVRGNVPTPMTRQDFDALARAFPDEAKHG